MSLGLFDQDYAMKAYGRTQEMKGVIEAYQEFGASIAEAIQRFAVRFGLSEEVSSEYVHEFWHH